MPELFAAIDFDTANQRAVSACAVAVARVTSGVPEQPQKMLILPPPGPFSFTFVHGIRRRHLRDAGVFRSVWPRLAPQLERWVVLPRPRP